MSLEFAISPGKLLSEGPGRKKLHKDAVAPLEGDLWVPHSRAWRKDSYCTGISQRKLRSSVSPSVTGAEFGAPSNCNQTASPRCGVESSWLGPGSKTGLLKRLTEFWVR